MPSHTSRLADQRFALMIFWNSFVSSIDMGGAMTLPRRCNDNIAAFERNIRRMALAGKLTNSDEMPYFFLYYCLWRSRARARLCLTNPPARHNNTYIKLAGRSYGQTQARSKTAGMARKRNAMATLGATK